MTRRRNIRDVQVNHRYGALCAREHRRFPTKTYSYTVTLNGEYRYPPLRFIVPSIIADFRSMYRKLAENKPEYLFFSSFK